MRKMKKILANVLGIVFLLAFMAFGVTGCGNKSKADGENEKEYLEDWSLRDETEENDEDESEDDAEDERHEKEGAAGNTFNNISFQIEEDGSLIIFDNDLEFVWYQDAEDRSINYFGGPAEVYYGEKAYDYITGDYANDGVYRKKSVFNFSEEKMAEFFEAAEEEPIYAKENMICMILHHEDIVVEDEYQEKLDNADELNPDTYYWGFYDGDTFLCYNIESGSLMTWIPVDDDGAQAAGHSGEDASGSEQDFLTGMDSHTIEVGTGTVTIAIPEGAEVAIAEDYMLSYYLGDICVDFSESYCEMSDDAMEALWASYDILGADESNSLDIEPEKTRVGENEAYYCRRVNSYSEDVGHIYYAFLIDIGEDHYLDVTVTGDLSLTEEEAFKLADVKMK